MKKALLLVAQKLIGIVMLVVSFLVMPIMDGDVTYMFVTVPICLLFIFTNKNLLAENFGLEDEDYEDEGL